MKRTTQPRATVNLSKSVQHQVNMYALVASATGVAGRGSTSKCQDHIHTRTQTGHQSQTFLPRP
jgi:hypothetical protein